MYDDILGPRPEKKTPKNKINLKSGESVSSSDAPEELELELDLSDLVEDSNPVDPKDVFGDDEDDEDVWDLGLDCDDECCDDCCDEGC